ncbi:MAG: hypothetical protein R3338_08875, partial [Thermoanaerobaculia bacterium]|nr:hypothetical protein [Thermoanaerobaculia bacterium]
MGAFEQLLDSIDQRKIPPVILVGGSDDYLVNHPPEASLEGFLFPDTYQVPLDADASYLVDLMLRNF